MSRISSTVWLHSATAPAESVFMLDLLTGNLVGSFFDETTNTYLEGLIDGFISRLPAGARAAAIGRVLPRLLTIVPLTGAGTLQVNAAGTLVEATLSGMGVGDQVLLQIPHSIAQVLSAPPPEIPEPPPSEVLGYRTVELGDASTGLWYVTIAARATSAALFAISVLKNADLSTPGPLGTFAIDVSNLEGLSVYSITAFTYTRAETQAKALVLLDNPQGPRFAHEVARCSAAQTTVAGAQSMTPVITVVRADGSIPAANGIPHQLDPTESYPRLRVSSAGFTAAAENVVTDPAYNKPQSLVIQF